jgi:hypothetical protein
MRKIVTITLTAGAAIMFAATAASAAGYGGGRAGTGVRHSAMVGAHASVPRGFHEGRKMGWHARSVPPGWSHGRKTGWGRGATPPGTRY